MKSPSTKVKDLCKRLRAWFVFYRESYLDGKRFLGCTPWAGRTPDHSLAQLESDIVRRYHVIEKGLAMPGFRPRFGEVMIRQLTNLISEWDRRPDHGDGDEAQIMAARAVIANYRAKHVALGIDVADLLGPVRSPTVDCCFGGTQPYRSVDSAASLGFEEVIRTRVSARNYDISRVVEQELIEKAVALAIRAPSVCNRQTWRVHQYSGTDAQRMLSLQSGNRGFGHTIPCVLVVTSDLRYFTATAERYQAWIDGGMFAMLLLASLHSLGLGSVALNWSVLNRRDEELRLAADIPAHERIIVMIGCGHPMAASIVPKSLRRSVGSILRRHS